jgi:RHS repeat-associated protein
VSDPQGTPLSISLPKGGGALAGIGETFAPDLHTGTGNFTVPIALPAGRNGFQPRLALVYSTGHGNGPFGLGWAIDVPGVERRTSKGVPRYDDGRDVFILSGAEDLVPVDLSAGETRYRPRTEGLFARIRHIHVGAESYWKVEGKDGLTSLYGAPSTEWPAGANRDPAAITSPHGRGQRFAWRLVRTTDTFGNRIEYAYARDAIQEDGPHLWDQLYLDEIRYSDYGDPAVPEFLFTVKFVYESRPDPFSDHRAGFEVRTVRRCVCIDVTSTPGESLTVRRYYLRYLDQRVRDRDPDLIRRHEGIDLASILPKNGASLLSQVVVEGFALDEGSNLERSAELPPLEFSYSRFEPTAILRSDFKPLTGPSLPPSDLGNPTYALVDLFGNGLPDVLEMNGTTRYWRNLGDGRLAFPIPMETAPAGLSLGQAGVQIIDANGDGRPDLLVTNGTSAGYFPLRFDGQWDARSFTPYAHAPTFDLSDPAVHILDLDGDGISDVVRSGTRLECFFNDADHRRAWTETIWSERRALADAPNFDFSDPRVRWADMTGDGLQDVVLIHDRRVDYWPNQGRGNWGKRVRMRGSPRLPAHYDARRALLGDVDGDGLADLIYVDDGKLTLWINQSSNAWSDPIEIRGTPAVTLLTTVVLSDMLGAGVSGVVWSTDAGARRRDRLLFLDLTRGEKPYLLTRMDNNLGAVTEVQYRPSTHFYLEDQKRAATRWRTPLPFPVHVVAKVTAIDELSQGKLTTEYRYRHGYWDGVEREFRGFGMVEQLDTETFQGYHMRGSAVGQPDFAGVSDSHFSPPTLTRTWFHQGPVDIEGGGWQELDLSNEYWSGDAPSLGHVDGVNAFLRSLPNGRSRRDALRALRGSILRTELYALDGSPLEHRPYTVTETQFGLVETDAPAGANTGRARTFFPHVVAQRTTQWERGREPLTQITFNDDYDPYGQPQSTIYVAVPRGRDYTAPVPATTDPARRYLATRSLTAFAQPEDTARYVVDRIARTTDLEIVNDGSLDVFSLRRAVLAGAITTRVIGQTVNFYDGPAFVGLGFRRIGNEGAMMRSEALVATPELFATAYPGGVPPYLDPQGGTTWTAEYPPTFRALPPLAGYRYHPSGGTEGYVAGYFAATSRQFDYQLAGVGRGLVVAARDPLGGTTSIEYDAYQLLPTQVTDPEHLATIADYDYRTLQPRRVTEPNGNSSEFRFHPLGLVSETWVRSKAGDGDIARASTRIEYDFLAFARSPATDRQPISARTIRFVHHDGEAGVPADEMNQTIESREYSDGFGRVLQTRAQGEDLVFGQTPLGDSIVPLNQPQAGGAVVGRSVADSTRPRVVVNGWKVYDNKGRVVEQYEPLFAEGWEYDGARIGTQLAKMTLHYDPRGQVVRTVHADGSEQRVVPGVPTSIDDPDRYVPTPWEAYSYDGNDNGGRTHPTGAFSYRHHWNTPSSVVIDALGRPIEATERTRAAPATDGDPLPPLELHRTRTAYDVQGNVVALTDPLGRVAFRQEYDLAKHPLRIESIDAGVRTRVFDAVGNVIEQRDAKGALVLHAYDRLHRLTRLWARDETAGDVTLRERAAYGTAADTAGNRAGRPIEHYDEAGLLRVATYDFKGNVTEKARRVLGDAAYAQQAMPVNWEAPGGMPLGAEYTSTYAYDALDRTTLLRLPQDVTGVRRVIEPHYGRSGALRQVTVGGEVVVKEIAYNARGQRSLVAYANGVMTRFACDPATFRLRRLRSESYSSPAANAYDPAGGLLQDFAYDYDLAGNVVRITERVPGCGVRNNPNALRFPELAGDLASGDALVRLFEYDPLYRLTSASGRECATISSPRPWAEPSWPNDALCGFAPGAANQNNAKDLTAPYTERFEYDAAGNMLATRHTGNGSTWTRSFGIGGFTPTQWRQESRARSNGFTAGGQVWAAPPGNHLTNAGDNMPGAPTTRAYDQSGNLIAENTDRHFAWDHADRLRGFFVQAGAGMRSIDAQYSYDSAGQRVVKVVRTQGSGQQITVYIDGVFEHCRWSGGTTPPGANTEVHVMDTESRIARFRFGPEHPDDGGPQVQFHLGDHLGSSAVVVGGAVAAAAATFVNREDFFAYGETSFGSFGRKRYRFTGKERDAESGLSYHGARYYAPHLARWVSSDPAGTVDGHNLYRYARSNPIRYGDRSGNQANTSQTANAADDKPVTAATGASSAPNSFSVAKQLLKSQTTPRSPTGDRLEGPYNLWSGGKAAQTLADLAPGYTESKTLEGQVTRQQIVDWIAQGKYPPAALDNPRLMSPADFTSTWVNTSRALAKQAALSDTAVTDLTPATRGWVKTNHELPLVAGYGMASGAMSMLSAGGTALSASGIDDPNIRTLAIAGAATESTGGLLYGLGSLFPSSSLMSTGASLGRFGGGGAAILISGYSLKNDISRGDVGAAIGDTGGTAFGALVLAGSEAAGPVGLATASYSLARQYFENLQEAIVRNTGSGGFLPIPYVGRP